MCQAFQLLVEEIVYPHFRDEETEDLGNSLGGPLARILCFHCQGPGFIPLGTKIPQTARKGTAGKKKRWGTEDQVQHI